MEDRQYQLDLGGINLSTGCWADFQVTYVMPNVWFVGSYLSPPRLDLFPGWQNKPKFWGEKPIKPFFFSNNLFFFFK